MLVQKTFSDLITFSRASAGWYFNSAGRLVQAAANVPRFDFDPVTRQPLGLLIEEGRTNLLSFSGDLTNSVWAKVATTVSPSAAIAPNGSLEATKVVENTATSTHPLRRTISLDASTTYSASWVLKAGERSACTVVFSSSEGNAHYHINLLTGEAVAGSVSTALNSRVSCTSWADGWFRVTVIFTTGPQATGTYLDLRLSNTWPVSSGTGASYAGDGSSGLYCWETQLEVGAFPTTQIRTGSAQVTRAEDIAHINSVAPWFNPAELTVYADWSTPYPVVGNRGPFWFNNNTDLRGIGLYYPSALALRGMYRADDGATLETPSMAATPRGRAALAFKDSSLALTVNGAPPAISSTASIGNPTVDRLRLGFYRASGSNTGAINGHVRSFRFWPYRLSNAELQALTA